MRSCGTMPYVHVTDLGPERSRAFGLLAQSVADLERLARDCGTQVEPNPEPAGGYRVTLTDPSGYEITVLAGIRTVEPLPAREPLHSNSAHRRTRLGAVTRVPTQPSHVHRLGHVAARADSPHR